jgi:cell division protein FtsI (penicillin-binding protein 3)
VSRIEVPRFEPEPEAPEIVRVRARRRIGAMGALMLGALTIAGARGVQLALFPADRTVRVAAVQRWDQVTLQARRGEILDRNGHRLATSVATPNIIVDPILVEPAELQGLAAKLADILDLPPEEVAEKLGRPSRYVRLAMRVHPAVAARIDALDHPALWVERTSRRYYPEETLASQLVGFVDTDGSGREGLEAELDSWLRGGQILLQRKRDRRGLSVDQPLRNDLDLNVGMNVRLTIDRQIQRMTERALEDVFAKHAPKAAWAVVVDVATGDILALANAPGFNPNALTEDPTARKNHVVQDAIEPGSVFKPFTAAAAIEEGIATPETKIDCENGGWNVARSHIRDDHPHGVVTLTEVIKYSSNIGTAKLALQMGARSFLPYVAAFGFGERTGVQLPGERAGVVRAADKIKPIELITTAFGQGVTATPLQLAMGTAALANHGVRMKPRLVTRVEDVHGVPEYIQKPAVAMRAVSAQTADQVRDMMITVTEAGGTATRATVPGYLVGGKTGTAQKAENGHYGAGRIGSFVGFIPADRPVLAIAVSVDEPSIGSKYGGIVAAPAFASIAGQAMRYLGIPPDPKPVDPDHHTPPAVAAVEPEPELALGWNGQGWTLPDLHGRPAREILASIQGSGLQVQLEGTGLAISQAPPPGASLAPGETLRVSFQ